MPEPDPYDAAPPPLLVAASIAVLEALTLLVLAVLVVFDRPHDDSLSTGLALAVFFTAYAVLLVAGAVGLRRLQSWPRGPVLITQLIGLGVAWNLRSSHIVDAVVLVIGAAVAIAGVVHPASMRALDRRDDQDSVSSD